MNKAFTGQFIFAILMFCMTQSSISQINMPIRADSSNSKDAWVWSLPKADTVNFGENNLYNGGLNNVIRSEAWKWYGRVEVDTIRSFLYFDLSQIPKNASIIEAKLSLFYYANPGFTPQLGANSILIIIVLESWKENTVTWQNQPKTSSHNEVIVPPSDSLNQSYLDIDVRNIVQEWIYFPEHNFGFLIRLLKESEFNGCTFASSEHPEQLLRPYLEITYISP